MWRPCRCSVSWYKYIGNVSEPLQDCRARVQNPAGSDTPRGLPAADTSTQYLTRKQMSITVSQRLTFFKRTKPLKMSPVSKLYPVCTLGHLARGRAGGCCKIPPQIRGGSMRSLSRRYIWGKEVSQYFWSSRLHRLVHD